MEINKIYLGDNIETLKTLDDNSVDCCITSPPYYGLRDYGTATWVGGDPNCPHKRLSKYSESTSTGHAQEALRGNVGDAIYTRVCKDCGALREDLQVGLEETPEEYVDRLVTIFREVRRVLKKDGTLWLNIGDTYYGSGGGRGTTYHDSREDVVQSGNKGFNDMLYAPVLTKKSDIYKPKDLIGIPWMLAFALRADGWYLRQDIIWAKPNPMPESVKDRCTKSHEYVFLLTKSPQYYFDYEAIQEPATTPPHNPGNLLHQYRISGPNDRGGHTQWEDNMEKVWGSNGMRNKRDVWSVKPSNYKGAHFATFPEELIEPMILAGCPEGGVVLDPFMGSGTTAIVAKANRRNYIGCELNPEYALMAEQRASNVTRKLF